MDDLQVAELERKNFCSNTDQYSAMELSLFAKVEILLAILVCRSGVLSLITCAIDSHSIVIEFFSTFL